LNVLASAQSLSGVGKSALKVSFTCNRFDDFFDPTLEGRYFSRTQILALCLMDVSPDRSVKQLVVDDKVVVFDVSDMADQYNYMQASYLPSPLIINSLTVSGESIMLEGMAFF
jgi:hypothetical protein